jgi:hypothetical protein
MIPNVPGYYWFKSKHSSGESYWEIVHLEIDSQYWMLYFMADDQSFDGHRSDMAKRLAELGEWGSLIPDYAGGV